MSDSPPPTILSRFGAAAASGARKSLGAVAFLLRIMVPVSLAVALLGWSGLLSHIAAFLKPFMNLIGLPGEAALAVISGALLTNYSAIAVLDGLHVSLRDATIVGVMCLISHNLIVETAVMKKAGSSALKMASLRVGTSIVAAFILNLALPRALADIPFSAVSGAGGAVGAGLRQAFWPMIAGWLRSTVSLSLKIVALVTAIMVLQKLLEEFRVTDALSRLLGPLMRLFGLAAETSFLWIVINIVGYAYGAGITVDATKSGRMKLKDADLLNHHAAISHSLLEDTILYAAVGIPVLWLMVPRLLLSVAVVWIERARRRIAKRPLRVGTY